MVYSGEVRARRPQVHEVLVNELRQEAGFATYRDVLLFAAAVGYRERRRVEFTSAAGDPIRYEVLTQPTFSDVLINMIAANVLPDDPEVMDDSRLEERIKYFEEYANGGLEYLQEQVNVRRQPIELIVVDLVSQALVDDGGQEPASVDELLTGATWG